MITHHGDLDVIGQLLGQGIDNALDVIDDRDGVLALRFHDVKRDGALAIYQCHGLAFFLAIDECGHLREIDRLATTTGHHNALEVSHRADATAQLHGLFAVASDDTARRQFLIFVA